jgi:hypothetical protein
MNTSLPDFADDPSSVTRKISPPLTNSVYRFLRYGAKQIRCAYLVRLLRVLILGPLVIPLELDLQLHLQRYGVRRP